MLQSVSQNHDTAWTQNNTRDSSPVTKAVHKGLLAILEVLGVIERLGIPLHLVHELRNPERVCTETDRTCENSPAGRVSHMDSVVRAVEVFPVLPRGKDDRGPDAVGTNLSRETRRVF
jgi:hypothetical protein